ncbi:hypothetical protein ASG25_08660 [Rhizobium sp. Leaf384]|uniref:hypothetical protein n=1 Tax=unclassified Rhizobium TaxID=2613769 RepID=UPI00071235F7|nr:MULTISPECIES: hypothetical protein [unclassified Rhizobium]KQR71652.1 hypothetical protein ASG03_04050 [Rhizobium sp. Leaf341]KQS75362.1 hypothetical protein ASG58_14800 [Rhizobium sp. Leaf383]KQS78722.1 hypothetical protein ASG25_08660 [Rhizobium sp. Leaf384]
MTKTKPMRRRTLLGLLAALPVLTRVPRAHAATEVGFDDLYGSVGVLGLTFSDTVKRLNGQSVTMSGFMAPPLKAEATFFVLTEIPMSICPFCSSDSDWPDNIVVVYLDAAQTFVQPGTRISVSGMLDVGTWTDPETGFVSRLRLRSARYWSV